MFFLLQLENIFLYYRGDKKSQNTRGEQSPLLYNLTYSMDLTDVTVLTVMIGGFVFGYRSCKRGAPFWETVIAFTIGGLIGLIVLSPL